MKKLLISSLIVIACLQSNFVVTDCSAYVPKTKFGTTLAGIGKSGAQKQQIMANSDVSIAKNNIAKLEKEKRELETKLANTNFKIQQETEKLGKAQTNLNLADKSVSDEKIQKEKARVDNINQKSSIGNQKLELKKLQLEYKTKLEIDHPGFNNLITRNKKLNEFTRRANSLIKAGTDFETLMSNLRKEFLEQ